MFIFCSHNKAHTANNMYKQAGGNSLLILRVRSIARLLIHLTVIAPPASSSATPFDTRSDTHYTRFRALTYK